MPRRRQVRLSYPTVFVDLALYLAQRHGRSRTAKTLGLPLSTIYRWHDERRLLLARSGACAPAVCPERLVADCEAHGFDLRTRVRRLVPVAAAVAPDAELREAPAPAPVTAAPAALALPVHGPANSIAPPGAASFHARVRRARDEIDQRYYAPLSCEHLAGIAGMSRFHFIRRFKQVYAVAPYHYLMQVRVRHARMLLGTTHQPLDAVAAAVGFDSPSSLCKAFKSVEGISLSAFFRGVRLGAYPPGRATAAPSAARA